MKIPSFIIDKFVFKNYIECNEDTQKVILECRNSPDIRKWMNNSEIISMENHLKFIESLTEADDRFYFAVFYKDYYIASIYIVLNKDNQWERGLYTIPDNQGRGLTSKFETFFIYMLYTNMGIKELVAEVKFDNIRSIAYHEKMGYSLISEDSKYKYYVLKKDSIQKLLSKEYCLKYITL